MHINLHTHTHTNKPIIVSRKQSRRPDNILKGCYRCRRSYSRQVDGCFPLGRSHEQVGLSERLEHFNEFRRSWNRGQRSHFCHEQLFGYWPGRRLVSRISQCSRGKSRQVQFEVSGAYISLIRLTSFRLTNIQANCLRLHNKGVYVKQAFRKMVNRGSWNDLKKAMKLEVDGKVVTLPHVEGIIILNILR